MSLTDKDLQNIKDIVEFSIEKSEIRMTEKIEGVEHSLRSELRGFKDEMHREISDIAEMNREFLTKSDNHETRIGKLEVKAVFAG